MPGSMSHVTRDDAGLATLAAWLSEDQVCRIGLEASGGYERMVIDALEAAGFELALLNPLRVRRFAQAKGRLAKNDRVDARTVAHFTAVLLEAPQPARRRALDPLVEHLTFRHRLREWIVDCDNQLEHLQDKALRRKTELRRRGFEAELAAIERKLAKLVGAHDDWRGWEVRLRSVPGVGPVLAQTLIALLPELGQLSRHAIACLVGVAPFDDSSGRHAGERHIKGGRKAVREILSRQTLQPGDRRLRQTPGRQKAQGHHCRLHAQAAGHAQCHGPRCHRLAGQRRVSQTWIPWFDWTTAIPSSRPGILQAVARRGGQ